MLRVRLEDVNVSALPDEPRQAAGKQPDIGAHVDCDVTRGDQFIYNHELAEARAPPQLPHQFGMERRTQRAHYAPQERFFQVHSPDLTLGAQVSLIRSRSREDQKPNRKRASR